MRGLKCGDASGNIDMGSWSHPTWVRGLKSLVTKTAEGEVQVAPYLGAWIEILWCTAFYTYIESHPTWVRGLKYKHILLCATLRPRRTLPGCVD